MASLIQFHQAMSNTSKFILLLLAMFCLFPSQAQDNRKQKLEELKVRLMDEIELANRILSETQKDRQTSIGTIETVQQKIKLRENLIRTLDREIEILIEEEEELKREMDTLGRQIEKQKAAYAEMIRHAYKSRSKTSRLMFILSAEDFNQAVRRLEYLKQISEFRKRQVREIEDSQQELAEKSERLRVQKVRKEALRAQLDQEKDRLSDEKLSQEEAIATYKSMEADLVKKLRQKQAEAKKIENEIQRIIAEEIRRAKEAAERDRLEREAIDIGLVRGRDFTSNTDKARLEDLIKEKRAALAAANTPAAEAPAERYELTPAARQLAANFAANQKRLPWPVDRGLVVQKFGPQRHPIVPSVVIDNSGIDIATESGSQVKAVFDGKVASIPIMPDGYRAIIVNHGDYFSVYQNVTNVKVVAGQEISKGQVIAEIVKNPVTNESRLHFEIWKNNATVDPLGWLAAK